MAPADMYQSFPLSFQWGVLLHRFQKEPEAAAAGEGKKIKIKMPGLQGENIVAALGSPIRRSKLSLKFLQKKETKRALDFSEPQADEPKLDNAAERPDAG